MLSGTAPLAGPGSVIIRPRISEEKARKPYTPAYGWIVYSPESNGIVGYTLRDTRQETIIAWLKNPDYMERDWKKWYNKGYRLLKVKITVVA